MSKIYEVRSVSKSDKKIHHWGAKKTREGAETLLVEKSTGDKKKWADKYHASCWVEEIDTTGMFEIPSLPLPRERFTTNISIVETAPEYWNTLRINIVNEAGERVAGYDRNYSNMYRTFEPFRQGSKMFALISSDYTVTSVMDLETGEIVASETPDSGGFCPVGFYVPDWWDTNDGSIIPGQKYWNEDSEEPKGNFGFVWGCIWGDDSSWKVQFLDLSQVQKGILVRDERFGYIELATNEKLDPKDFIDCQFYDGECKVTFSVFSQYDLKSGKHERHEFD
jgi:hypothetical protein